MVFPFNQRVFFTLFSALVILGGTLAAIQYAKGNYRITRDGFAPGTGLLNANSFPTGAQVFINQELVTATDDTIYLQPGTYEVEVSKEGYSPWKKSLTIEQELVTQTNALLFPRSPILTPLTFTGAQNVSPSPDGQKILYYTASASAQTRNGLYLLELTNSPLSFQRGVRQIAEDNTNFDLANAKFIWSPDSTEVMLIDGDRYYLLPLDRKNELATLPEVTFRQRQVLSEWEEEMYIRERQFLQEFPLEVVHIATQSARNVYLSPDKKRLMYTATVNTTLPTDLIPPVPATNNQPETRTLTAGTTYIYDREEDRNFAVGQAPTAGQLNFPLKNLLATDLANQEALSLESSPSAFRRLQATTSAQTALMFNNYHTPLYADTFQWFPDSRHILYTANNRVQVKSYDNTNDTTIYAGPFVNDFAYPWPDGSRLLILTSFSPDTPPNLYAIELK